jgi:uncharacterized protein (DUF58 family)
MSVSRQVSRSRSLFFSTYWLYGAGLLVLIGALVGERALSLLGLLTLTTVGGSWLWARYSLDGVEYTRTLESDRLFSGESVIMHFSVVNRKLLPLAWLDVEDQVGDRLKVVDRDILPSGIPGVDVLRITTAARWYERITWTVEIDCPSRGYHPLGPISLRSGDLFGFFNRRETVSSEARLTVYPNVVSLEDINVPARHLFGDQRIRRQIITDPSRTAGVRDYRPEDSIRFVDWKATARVQTLQTRIFEPTTEIQFGVFLNLDTFEHYWEGLDYARAEGAIVVAASMAMRALDERHSVGMYANGVVGGSDQALRVRAGRSPVQREEILTGLAKLSPIASLNFPRLLRAETRRFPMGSTIVIVTAIMTDAIASVMAEMTSEGHRIMVLTIGDGIEVPSMRSVTTFAVDQARLKDAVPKAQHYAIRMTSAEVPSMVYEGPRNDE